MNEGSGSDWSTGDPTSTMITAIKLWPQPSLEVQVQEVQLPEHWVLAVLNTTNSAALIIPISL